MGVKKSESRTILVSFDLGEQDILWTNIATCNRENDNMTHACGRAPKFRAQLIFEIRLQLRQSRTRDMTLCMFLERAAELLWHTTSSSRTGTANYAGRIFHVYWQDAFEVLTSSIRKV